jgi:hypothetical protein
MQNIMADFEDSHTYLDNLRRVGKNLMDAK